ncbi:MAG: hypothetical protein ACM31G_01375 [Flavobacteriales bacterium]
MTFNLFFNAVIYMIITLLMIFIIKVYRHNIRLNRIGREKQAILEVNFIKEKSKGQIINERISLVNSLEQTLFYRLLEITKELIALQKLLLNSN